MIAGELINLLGFQMTGQDALRRFNAGMDQAENNARGMTGRFERLGAVGPLAMAGVAVAGAAAGAAMVDGVKQAARYETALSNIQKKGGFAADEMSRISDEIRDMVQSGQVTAGPIEIAEAYERLAAAGIPLGDLREMALLATQTADAFGMSEEAAANAFAGFRVGIGLAQDQLRPFADLINTLADSGISDEKDIVDFVDRAGPSLKVLGLQAEQIAAIGATLLNAKFRPEVAGTFMNALAGKFMNPNATEKMTGAFVELYGSVDKFQDMLEKDAIGTIDDFFNRLDKMDNRSRASTIQEIFGAEWSDDIQRLIAAREELGRNLAIAGDPNQWMGSLDSSYQKKLKTVEAQWGVFTSNLQMLKIDLGTLILPPASNFLADATQAIKDFGNSIDDIKSRWLGLMEGFENLTGLRLNSDGTFSDLSNMDETAAGDIRRNDPRSGAAGAIAARDLSNMEEAFALVEDRRLRKQEIAEGAPEFIKPRRGLFPEYLPRAPSAVDSPMMDVSPQTINVDPPNVEETPVKAEIVGEEPSWWNPLNWFGGDDQSRNAADNITAATDAAAAAGAVITDNSVQTDARQFPMTTNVNVGGVNVTQSVEAPAAVGQAVGNAAAGAVNQQAARISQEPAL